MSASKAKVQSITTNATIGQGPGCYHGYEVTVVTAVGAINIRDGSISGTIVAVIPAATAVGSGRYYAHGIAVNGPIFVEYNGGATGTVSILYE
jgi:hypothetical protein